jgi:hypothetical protein
MNFKSIFFYSPPNKKTGPHSESGLVYQFKRNGSHHCPRYFHSIQAMIEGRIPPVIIAQLNRLKPFDVDANLTSTIVRVWLSFHR